MDPELRQIIQFLIIGGIVVFAIARSFLRIFVKPFVPPGSPPGAPPRREGVKDFLEELRRDLGHGSQPGPDVDGLLDEEEDETRKAAAPPRPVVDPRFERPAAPPPMAPLPQRIPPRMPPVQRERPRPAVRGPASAETAGAHRTRMDAEAARRIHPSLIESTSDQIETEALATAAGIAPPMDEVRPIAQILGTDLETAFILKEVLGPPRVYQRLRRRG